MRIHVAFRVLHVREMLSEKIRTLERRSNYNTKINKEKIKENIQMLCKQQNELQLLLTLYLVCDNKST